MRSRSFKKRASWRSPSVIKATAVLLSLLLLPPAVGWAAVEVIPEAAHDVSPPLRSIPMDQLLAAEASRPPRQIPLRRLPRRAPPAALMTQDTALQSSAAPSIPV